MNAKEKLTKTVRKARRLGFDNKIEAIKAIRVAYSQIGLREAKDFWDLIDGEWSIYAATEVAVMWCPEHWDYRPCRECASAAQPQETPVAAAAGCAVQAESVQTEELVVAAGCGCKPGAMKKDCADPWHRASWWVGQPGNYTKLMTWIDAGMPDDESIPFAKRESEWLGVEAR